MLVLKLKILDLKLPFYPCFTSLFSKSAQQFQKLVQPNLKNGATEFWPDSTEFGKRTNRILAWLNRICKTEQPNFGLTQPNLQTGSTEFANRFNRFLHCSPLSLPVCQSVLSEKGMCRFLENRFNRILNPVQPNLKPVEPNFESGSTEFETG